MAALAGPALIALSWSHSAAALPGRSDYDLDDDGLIEIEDFFDLVQISDNLDGSGIWGEPPATLGCPAGGCIGFELTTHFDFDTNGNGEFDSGDIFYNEGNGWQPIGSEAEPFTGWFDGNGFEIRNLTQAGVGGAAGFFGYVRDTTIENLEIRDWHANRINTAGGVAVRLVNGTLFRCSSTGTVDGAFGFGTGGLVAEMTNSTIDESYSSVDLLTGDNQGGLVGRALEGSTIRRSFATGRVASGRRHSYAGGLAGELTASSIENSFATGNVGVAPFSGGLVGGTNPLGTSTPGTITNSFATGHLLGDEFSKRGLVGSGAMVLVNSYWARDLSGVDTTEGAGGQSFTAAQLRCPQFPGDPSCGLGPIYQTWGAQTNSDGTPLWHFGTAQQLPALNIQASRFRDADGDGVLDADDDYPLNYAASKNSDGDMSHDRWKEGCDEDCRARSGLVLDQFPDKIAATFDLDLDGYPESWNPLCFGPCRANSGLVIDPSPGDLDNDFIPDSVDTDVDGDGELDVDADSNGLLDIETWSELDHVRNHMGGQGFREFPLMPLQSGAFDLIDDDTDTSGCPPRIFEGVLARACDGYELLADLDFDTNDDGAIGPGDEFYRAGDGWDPLGNDHDPFYSAFLSTFEGNGHVIHNLFIGLPGESRGLFGTTQHAVVRNLGLDGPLMSLTVTSDAGALIGIAINTDVRNVFTAGEIFSDSGPSVGGLIGESRGSRVAGALSTANVTLANFCSGSCGAGSLIGSASGGWVEASFATGSVAGTWQSLGGLIGWLEPDSESFPLGGVSVRGTYSTGYVGGLSPQGGLIGQSEGPLHESLASHWATDTSGQATSAGSETGYLLSELQCPVGANDTGCAGATLYSGWQSYTDESGAPYWDFGDSTQLPGLCLGGNVYRDGDADGVLEPPEACGAGAADPCAGICADPQEIDVTPSYNNVALGTGESCFFTMQPVNGGNCNNVSPSREISVNGAIMPCNTGNWAFLPGPRSGGYCIHVEAGQPWDSGLTLW